MNTYLLIANNEETFERTELGTIQAHSLSEAALFLAYHFPEHYYLATIFNQKEPRDFLAIAASSYYASFNNGEVPNPVDVAVKDHMMSMKHQNDLYEYIKHDERSTIAVYEHLISKDGRIVKDDVQEE